MNNAQFVDVCEGPFAMLRLCNLPANEDAVELIFKFQAETYGQHQYELIYMLFDKLDYHLLNNTLEVVPDLLIRFLLQHPQCQQLRLLSLFLFPAIGGNIKLLVKELITFNGKMADNAMLETVNSWLNDQSRHAGNPQNPKHEKLFKKL